MNNHRQHKFSGNGVVASAYQPGFRVPGNERAMRPLPQQATPTMATMAIARSRKMQPSQNSPSNDQQAMSRSSLTQQRPVHHPPPTQLNRERKKRHRKRHVPVGPAGLWFERQQQKLAMLKKGRPTEEFSQGDEDEEAYYVDPNESWQRRNTVGGKLVSSFSPAWTAMQCERKHITPSIPLFIQNTETRYNAIRPHVPENVLLLPDVLKRVEQGRRWRLLENESLNVLVDQVVAHHWLLWSVTLTDETGVSMEGWIQPDLVRREEKKVFSVHSAAARKANQKMIQTGFVWELVNCSVVLKEQEHSLNEDDQEELERHRNMLGKPPERMLLIGKENIKNVWTPDHVREIPDEVYIKWMEARSALGSPRKLNPSRPDESGQYESGVKTGRNKSAPETKLDRRPLPPMASQLLRFPDAKQSTQEKQSGGTHCSTPRVIIPFSTKSASPPAQSHERLLHKATLLVPEASTWETPCIVPRSDSVETRCFSQTQETTSAGEPKETPVNDLAQATCTPPVNTADHADHEHNVLSSLSPPRPGEKDNAQDKAGLLSKDRNCSTSDGSVDRPKTISRDLCDSMKEGTRQEAHTEIKTVDSSHQKPSQNGEQNSPGSLEDGDSVELEAPVVSMKESVWDTVDADDLEW